MKNTKKINWFWKNWTEDEKRIYKKCTVFAVIIIMIEIIAAIMCINPFHAAAPTYDDTDKEISVDSVDSCPVGYHHETRWDDEKGEWYSVYVPDKKVSVDDLVDDFNNKKSPYKVDESGTLYIFQRIFNIIYSTLLPLASVMACTLVGYNYCMIMTSKNRRKIDESYTHIKVVAKTWLYIMCTSVFITLAMQAFNQLINSPLANPILKP